MKTKKLTLTLILTLSLIFWISLTKADENIYLKIDNLVKTNREKAENFYKALWQIYNYTWDKLWISNDKIDNINWFNFEYLVWKQVFDISYFLREFVKWIDLNQYWPQYNLHNLDTTLISLEYWKIYVFNNVKNEFIQKYSDVVNWKISLNSKEFEKINIYWRTDYNIFNVRWWFAQVSPFKQEFIKDKNWKIKWIWFYCFEWQDVPGNLKYKIYSVKDKALLEVDIDVIWDLSSEENQKYIDKFMKNTDSDFDLEKYKEIFFKNGYFQDENKSKEYWINIKNEIEFYKEIVKNS